ncbi:MAG: DUF2877 domain-containing protein [Ktedonobacteraceae bacterium]
MAVTLEALDYSRPVQPLFAQAARSGIVHSVFPKALNIVVDDTLFVLLSSEVQRMPNGARLPAIVMEQLYAKLSPATEVSIGDHRLYIPTLDFSIYLPGKAAWEPVPAIAAHRWHRSVVTQHACTLARHLAHRSQQDGLAPLVKPLLLRRLVQETPLAKMALPLLRLLVRATRQQDITGVEKAARGLAGLGPGLTPSGDDTLGGFIGVLALLSKWGRTPTRGVPTCGLTQTLPMKSDIALATIIADTARTRTTILSATLLAHAARGELAEYVGDLLISLALPVAASDAVIQAAERVLAYGACSGGDTLLGILLGLQASGIDYPIDYTGESYGYTGATQAQYVL